MTLPGSAASTALVSSSAACAVPVFPTVAGEVVDDLCLRRTEPAGDGAHGAARAFR